MAGTRRSIHPPNDYPAYKSSTLRAPKRSLRELPSQVADLTVPVSAGITIGPRDTDLTRQHEFEPLGERITISGHVRDAHGSPVAGALIEVWQANAAGRYAHISDQHPAPLDPNFSGAGRCLTDAEGRYHFVTIKPGAYPWRNHPNAWRPAHVHFSVSSDSFAQRLVTQMYFPGDPLLTLDPLFNSVPDPDARQRLIARWSHELTRPEWSLGYEWNIVVAGRDATPRHDDGREDARG
jgi:protocatechuate 3,4-dioxygenase, beta subunit